MNDFNSANDNGLHNGIPANSFQSLFNASSGQDLANKIVSSGLSLNQLENEIDSTQGQEILDKFGNDADFQALLNGQTGIPQTTYQTLIDAHSGQEFVNQFAKSGLTLAQAKSEILPSQAQGILNKFGSDSDFQAFLHGQPASHHAAQESLPQGIPQNIFQNLTNAHSGQEFVNQFANSGLTLAQAEAEITPEQAQAIINQFGSDSDFQAFLHGQTLPQVSLVGIVNHDAQQIGHEIQHFG